MNYAHKNFVLYILLIGFFTIGLGGKPAHAQTIIRDTEIEAYLSEWFAPIFKANNMQPSQVKIILVQSNDVNAFVAGGSNIFFYTGLIEKTENPGELIGVMAHELGHVSGGHLVRGRAAMESASYEALLGAIVGVGAAVASGDAGAVAAGSIAGSSMAQRRFLAKTRTFESSADQAAITSMNKAGMNPTGLATFLEKLEGQELLATSQQSEYVRSHPLTRNRVASVEAAIQKSDNLENKFPAHWYDQHARMKAKLMGYINPEQVTWNYDVTDKSIPALYARAVADYRQNNIEAALSGVDSLIAREPSNPYFHELKGQMLVDFGRVPQSIEPYKKAISLMPESGLMRIAYGQAIIESSGERPVQLKAAIETLKRAARDEPRSTRVHRLLATAYGRLGDDAMARLHLAEEALLQGKGPYAKQQADMALKELNSETDSAAYLRAKDIILFSEQKK